MPTPFVQSVEQFPPAVTMSKRGDEKVSADQMVGGATVNATLGGKVTTTFSLEHTNLSFDATGRKKCERVDNFEKDETKFIPIGTWSFHCPASQTPDSSVAMRATARYEGGDESPAKSRPIDVVEAPAAAMPAIVGIAAPVTRVVKAVLARATGGAKPKSAPKKRAAKSTSARKKRTSKPAPSSKRSAAKPKRSQPKSSAAKTSAKKSPRKSRPASRPATRRAKGSKGRK